MIPQNLSPPSSRSKQTTKASTKNRKLASTKGKVASDDNIVQWKKKNIKDGFVVVNETQLSKLIKREPIEKYYKLEAEPFAKGLFASVRKCQSIESGENFAAKFSSRRRYGEDCSAEIYHEIALLSLCGSAPRIIQLHDVFETKHEIILVMEYAPGGDLQTVIDDNLVPFESDVVSFIRQTVEGLDYLHRRKIAHLDVKPQNIVMMGDFPDCEIKLCDFEISRVILEGTDVREILGTPDYVAPEVLHYDPITLAADMWSLGVTTYVLLTGFSPFGGETDQETFCNISRGELDLPQELFQDISPEGLDFVKSLLVKEPNARLTAADCLKHPWLRRKKDQVPTPLIRHDSDPVSKEKPPDANRNRQALGPHLSKSREALFEKIIQQHKSNNNLRKNTIKNQFFNQRRLCESQISLISKSREKLLNSENLTPSFSRSIEKIYGLRSLSKSHEVLNLYKNGSLLTSQENINLVSEILSNSHLEERRLTRAITATDLGMEGQHRPICSSSSTNSISPTVINAEKEEEEKWARRNHNEDELENRLYNEKKEETKEECDKLMKELEKLEESRRINKRNVNEDGNDLGDEPRFTVAQLIAAYNKHQEIVTKTSLEVTMTAQEKEIKIPPIIPYESKSPFPTGPTALRLFIPDIDLIEMPEKSRHKIRFLDDKSDTSEPNSGEWAAESDKSERSQNVGRLASYEDLLQDKKYTSSSSPSSEASTTISAESLKPIAATPPITCKENDRKDVNIGENLTVKVEQNQDCNGTVNVASSAINPHKKRSKSTSPAPRMEKGKLHSLRKLSFTSCSSDSKIKEDDYNKRLSEGKNVQSRSSGAPCNSTRKTSVVENVHLQRKSLDGACKCDNSEKPPSAPNFKIIGIGEGSGGNFCHRRSSGGVGYKIEFESPVVTRKFDAQRNKFIKGTISSDLKSKTKQVKKT